MGVAPLESVAGSAASAGTFEASKPRGANNALAARSNRIEPLPARRKTPTAILRHLVLRLHATNGRRALASARMQVGIHAFPTPATCPGPLRSTLRGRDAGSLMQIK